MRHSNHTSVTKETAINSVFSKVSYNLYSFWKNTFHGFNNYQIAIVLIYTITAFFIFSSLLYFIVSTGTRI